MNETLERDNATVVEGVPVAVSLSFTRGDIPKVTTKAALSETEETKVYDICLFIFNKSKKLEYLTVQNYADGNTDRQGTIQIAEGNVTSGQKYIYAIANTEGGAGSFSTTDLSSIKDMDDLKSLVSTLNENTDQRLGGHLLMSGFYKKNESDTAADGGCVIPSDVNGATLGGYVELKLVDSRITFKIGVEEESNITFVPRTWKVVNIPKHSYVFAAIEDYTSATYFNSDEKTFDNSTIVDTKYKGGSFTFYMYENRKAPLRSTDNYNDRERQEKDANGLNGNFIYADPKATYVVLTGDYSDGDKTTAQVRYTIHLGYKGNNASDFFSERNTIYTYKVTVTGVQNIIVEVESSQPGENFVEDQSGAEGSVVVAEQSLSVDAHYEAKNVIFRKNDLSNLSVIVSTPYTKGSEKFVLDKDNGKITVNELTDYKWVQFVRRKADSGLAKFPGTEARTEVVDADGIYTEDDGRHFLTIDQVLKQLYAQKEKPSKDYWTNTGEVVYTAFIDEYCYDTDKPDSRDWRSFVNVDDRKMHILCNTKYSLDKQSDLTTANIMISQRSLKTIYNKKASGFSSAWGIETTDETKAMPSSGKDKVRTSKNGRYLTFKMLGFDSRTNNGDWADYVDWTSENGNKLKSGRRYAEYACLQRNRDLNGDGKIDADEIRWYLPSTTQYTGLWIGKDALYPEARMFQKDPAVITDSGSDGGDNDNFRSNNHFFSSNGIRFWAEEGAATGNNTYSNTKSKFNYRCARNLGRYITGVPEEKGNVDDYVIATTDKDGIVTAINLTRVDPLALRSTKESSLAEAPEHTGADLNRPYKKFLVEKTKDSKCPTGYREANQREISLMAGYSTSDMGNVSSCTYSDLNYKENVYYKTRWDGDGKINIVTLSGGKNDSLGRCVKDVDE